MADDIDELKKRYSGETFWAPEEGGGAVPPGSDDISKLKQLYKADWKHGVRDTTVRSAKTLPDNPLPSEYQPGFKGQTLQVGPFNTGLKLSEAQAERQAQLGSGMADVVLGAQQIFGKAPPAAADEKRRIDKTLNAGPQGATLNFLGKALPFLVPPAGLARAAGPIAGPLIEGVGMGAGTGALEPAGVGDSRAVNTGLGAGFGAVVPGIMGAGRAAARVDPETARLQALAESYGIPLSLADVTRNKMIKAYRSVADDSILPGASSLPLREAQQEAFQRAFGNAWGNPAPKHTGQSLAADRSKIGQELERHWNSVDVPYIGSGLQQKMADIRTSAAGYDTNIREGVSDAISELEKKLVFDPSVNDFVVPGSAINNFQKDWRKKFESAAQSQGDTKAEHIMKARKEAIDAFRTQVPPQQLAAMDEARARYRALKSIEGPINKAGLGRAGRESGDIRPSDLSGAVLESYPNNPLSSPFGELPAVGERFLMDRVARTGGSPRAAVQNTAIGAGLYGLGAGVGWPAAVGLAGLGIGTSRLLNSPGVLRALQANPYATGRSALPGAMSKALPPAGGLTLLNNFYPGGLSALEEEVPNGAGRD